MTTGRNPAEAVSNYRHSIQRMVSCVTTSVVDVAGGYHPSAIPHRLTMNGGVPVALGGSSQFRFGLQQTYRIIESELSGAPWRVDVIDSLCTIIAICTEIDTCVTDLHNNSFSYSLGSVETR